jgi:hypothetical protein
MQECKKSLTVGITLRKAEGNLFKWSHKLYWYLVSMPDAVENAMPMAALRRPHAARLKAA